MLGYRATTLSGRNDVRCFNQRICNDSRLHSDFNMKIAIIGTIAESIVTFRREFIEALVAKGHKVYAFALDYDDSMRAAATRLGVLPVDYTFRRSATNPFADCINTYRLFRTLKRISPDLVFSYFVKPVVFGTLAAAFARIPRRVAMLEGLGYAFTDYPVTGRWKRRWLRWVQIWLYRMSFPLLENLIFLNPDDPIDLLEKYNLRVRRMSVLGGIGLNLEQFPFSEPPIAPVTFLFVGRLLAEKGINDFVSAAKIVHREHASARFVVLGQVDESNPGSLSSVSLEKCIDNGLIIHPGYVDDVPRWISSCSVFVLPSYREGVPRSTQEAMAVGRAVITTDVPGCRETVVDGVNGFLVPPLAPDKLAEKMIYFVKNTDKIKMMGLESYRIAKERFDVHVVNRRLLNLLGI